MENKVQEKVMEYQYLQQELNTLNEYRENLLRNIEELKTVMDSIKEMEKSGKDKILFPFGGGVFAYGEIDDNSYLLINVGSGIYVKRSLKEANDIIKKRVASLEKVIDEIEDRIKKYSSFMNKVVSEIQEMQKK